MKESITQLKFTPETLLSNNPRSSILCTLQDSNNMEWFCEFKEMSLFDIAKFIVDFFNSTTVTVKRIKFTICHRCITVFKSKENCYDYYLECISKQLHIG